MFTSIVGELLTMNFSDRRLASTSAASGDSTASSSLRTAPCEMTASVFSRPPLAMEPMATAASTRVEEGTPGADSSCKRLCTHKKQA